MRSDIVRCASGGIIRSRGDQVPARLAPPGGLADRAAKGVHAPRDLRVGHERGLFGAQVTREGSVELVPVEKKESVHRRQDRGLRPTRREAAEERVHRFARVGCEGADIDKRTDTLVNAGLADHCPAVGVSHQDSDPHEAGGRRVIFLSGDDADAKTAVGVLFESAGFSTIDLGYPDTGGLIQQVHGPLAGLDLIRI